MAIIYPMASSSKGNCTYVGSKACGVLIDAGIGIRSFLAHLALIGVPPQAIRGILITHEHSDHIKGLARIQKALGVPVYASKGTLRQLLQKRVIAPQTPMGLIPEAGLLLDGMRVTAFATPHDCEQSQCYRICMEDGASAVVCTDLGEVTEEIHRQLLGSDAVMLESNYEESMLLMGRYPYFLKRRIAGARGHLSNESCAAELCRLYEAGVRRFVLGHLSEENNRPEIALETMVHMLSQYGAVPGQDFQLLVAPRENNGKWMEFQKGCKHADSQSDLHREAEGTVLAGGLRGIPEAPGGVLPAEPAGAERI